MSIHKDQVGQTYLSPDPKNPANSGTTVTIYTANGPKQGTMVSGIAVPNKS